MTLVEKGDEPCGGGNTPLSGGVFHAVYREPWTDESVLFDDLFEATDRTARVDVVRAWAANVGRALRFLEAEGGDFRPLNPDALPHRRAVLHPVKYGTVIGRDWRGGGPDLLLRRMHSVFVENGGVFRSGTPATELVIEGRLGIGAIVVEGRGGNERIEADAVVLADGGFQANPDLVRKYITSAHYLRGGDGDTGDGLQMALHAGAALHEPGMARFYGHLLPLEVRRDQRLWPEPSIDPIVKLSAVVDHGGRRFVDEGLRPEQIANAVARSESPDRTWVVFDNDCWNSVGRAGWIPFNPGFENTGGRLDIADDLTTLAQRTGIPGNTLVATIETFNRYAKDGIDVDPPRTGNACPLLTSPFYAIPLIAGITYAMGGVLIDGGARVLDREETPIPGLYAAGGTIGGLQGGPRTGYSGGWSEAATFGILAAESITASVSQASAE